MSLQRRARPKRSKEAQQRRLARAAQRDDDWFDFVDRVRNATPHGHGDCHGTPWCPTALAHRGITAHHIHQRSLGGTNHTSNGAWLCQPGHRGVHDHIQTATELGLLASSSEPWPPTPTEEPPT